MPPTFCCTPPRRCCCSGAVANDRRSLAQRAGGGRLRHPSAARGIGGLGGGTEGRPERAVLHADVGGIRRLCPPPVFAGAIPGGDGAVRPWADGQADAGDAAVCVAAAGLLAAGTHERSRHTPRAVRFLSIRKKPTAHGACPLQTMARGCGGCCGENPVVCLGGRFVRRDDMGPDPSGRVRACRERALALAGSQRDGFLRRLSGANVFPGEDWRPTIPIRDATCPFGKLPGPQ